MSVFRHEKKYVCDKYRFAQIKDFLNTALQLDSHVAADGRYHIRSIYFDDYANHDYYDVENGNNIKDKWRIRIYNCDSGRISLEKKSKIKDMTRKRADLIGLDVYYKIMDKTLTIGDCKTALLKEFYIESNTRLLEPKCIVDYVRTPFICEEGNVRITFDDEISYSRDFEGFFDEDLPLIKLHRNESSLLEIKYDLYIPEYIINGLLKYDLLFESYSKYHLCRMEDEN